MILFFAAVPRTSLAGLHIIVGSLPYAKFKSEGLDSLLSIPTHTRAVVNKYNFFNETQFNPPVRISKKM